MKKVLSAFLFCCLAINFVSAQIVKTTSNTGLTDGVVEKINLYTDRDFYISGETIWFVAFNTVNAVPFDNRFSHVLYIELFAYNQKPIIKKKFIIEEGIAKGNFTIPEEALSGKYYLRAYTQFIRNATAENYFTMLITVINPERPLPETERIMPDSSRTKHDVVIENVKEIPVEISINASKKYYAQREFIELELSANTSSLGTLSHVSVSVVKHGTCNEVVRLLSETGNFKLNNLPENLLWLPEIRDVSISGVIRDKKTGLPEANARVYLSVLGKDPQFHINNSGKNGEFIFSLNHTTNLNEIFVCSDPDPDKDLELLINNDFSNNYPAIGDNGFFIDTSYKKLIGEMYINYQTSKVFNIPDSIPVPNLNTINPMLFGKPDISITLNDFIDMPTLEDVFKELVPSVSIKKKKGKSYLQMLNAETNRMNNCKYVFIDNILLFDVDALLQVPPSKIGRIDVINRTTYLGDFSLEGMILIRTNTDNFAGITFPQESSFLEYQCISPVSDFSSPVYRSEAEKVDRKPDFRTLLYWNPDLTLQNGKAGISFYASDYCADYDVNVRGITAEGRSCFGKSTLKVRPVRK